MDIWKSNIKSFLVNRSFILLNIVTILNWYFFKDLIKTQISVSFNQKLRLFKRFFDITQVE